MKQSLLRLIRFYQKYLNINNSITKALFLTDNSCRFNPTCSQYSYEAILKYGILRGLLFSLKRIVRCHPFNKGGYDPIP